MDGLNKLSMRKKAAVIYTHPNIAVLHGFEGAVDRWIDEDGVDHVYLKPGGKYYLSDALPLEHDGDRAASLLKEAQEAARREA